MNVGSIRASLLSTATRTRNTTLAQHDLAAEPSSAHFPEKLHVRLRTVSRRGANPVLSETAMRLSIPEVVQRGQSRSSKALVLPAQLQIMNTSQNFYACGRKRSKLLRFQGPTSRLLSFRIFLSCPPKYICTTICRTEDARQKSLTIRITW
ncbi:hypothetical protein BDV96DRAFT_314022 [Lophiotrema nucula]|uniref:Uncharacterized protein n=1 Tax=Lophiotrema nucula TaxID=690887 RepID=A0A6A5ZJU7_9PLEO|nr:hypothetical protein BDV96DRAFT_314022 [Lophiotrema nucula]